MVKIPVENQNAFILGLIMLILSGVSMFVPLPSIGIFSAFTFWGTLLLVNSSILFFLGGIWDSEKTENVAFGLGIPSWALLIIGSFLGIIWSPNIINQRIMEWIMSLIAFFQYGLFLPMSDFYITMAKAGYIGSFIDLGIGIASFIMGIKAFRAVSEKF
ncbi:MAG: hypothetical protein ACTSR3_06220 [Candidatus Helarchaeota archaeon]